MQPEIILQGDRGITTAAPAPATTYTFTLLNQFARRNRVSVFVLSTLQPTTVNFRMRFGADGVVSTQNLRGKTGGTANASEWWIDTTEDMYPGDLLIDVVTGGVAPGIIRVLAVVQQK